MRAPAPSAAFRTALRTWQATGATTAPASLMKLAAAAILEVDTASTRTRQTIMARARAAITALDAGHLDEARAVLVRMMADETEQ